MFTLKNPNLIPWAKGYSNTNPSGLCPSRIWIGMGPRPSGYQFGFSKVNILRSLDSSIAAKYGQLKIFKLIAESTEWWNCKNNMGETPLYLAAKNNHFDILKIQFEVKPCRKKRKNTEEPVRASKRSKFH